MVGPVLVAQKRRASGEMVESVVIVASHGSSTSTLMRLILGLHLQFVFRQEVRFANGLADSSETGGG